MNSRKSMSASLALGNRARNNGDDGLQAKRLCICRFNQLPRDLAIEILSKLPLETIFHCRCVCKAWYELTSDPDFVKRRSSDSPFGVLVQVTSRETAVHTLRFVRVEPADPPASFSFRTKKKRFAPRKNLPIIDIGEIRVCNGLLCLSGAGKRDPIYVCNPISGEYIAIPIPEDHKNSRYTFTLFGFGCGAVSNQYKVIQSFMERPSRDGYEKTKIYSIGTGEWRSTQHMIKSSLSISCNSFLNGVLHWIENAKICTFDFETEQFGTISPPTASRFWKLTILRGHLSVCSPTEGGQFAIWLMKEYNRPDSWSKEFVIENLYLKQNEAYYYEPFMVLDSDEILMIAMDNVYMFHDIVVCYNVEQKYFKPAHNIIQSSNRFAVAAYTPSFISLRQIAGQEYVFRIQRQSTSASTGQR